MSGHTEGPWLPDPDGRYFIGGSGGPVIATVGVGRYSQDCAHLVGHEHEANAHLIAAAPTMLHALETAQPIVCKATCSGDDHSAECLHITATLAEAKGGDA